MEYPKEFPDTYVVFYLEEYYEALQAGMKNGDPGVDHVDIDGEKAVANCQKIHVMYMSSPEGRKKHEAWEKFLESQHVEKEPWEE